MQLYSRTVPARRQDVVRMLPNGVVATISLALILMHHGRPLTFILYFWSLQYHKDWEPLAILNQFWYCEFLGTWQDSVSARDHLVSRHQSTQKNIDLHSCCKRDLIARPRETSDPKREVQQMTRHNHTVWSWNYSHFKLPMLLAFPLRTYRSLFSSNTFRFHWIASADFNDVCTKKVSWFLLRNYPSPFL
jgi:hypothetical protein